VHEISGVVPGTTIDDLLKVMGVEPGQGIDQSLAKGGFEAVKRGVKGVIREGWSAGQVLEQVSSSTDDRANRQIHDAVIPIVSIPTIQKSQAALAIAECDKALCEGGDEELQLLECCLRIREAMMR
jgi:replication factor C subunit 2/4